MLVNGFVYDSVFRTLEGAVVEVLDGPQAGLSATADATGRVTLTGNFDDNTLPREQGRPHRFNRDAHYLVRHLQWRALYLFHCGSPRPALEHRRHRSLRFFVADSACTDIPSELRTRTYNATITPGFESTVPAQHGFPGLHQRSPVSQRLRRASRLVSPETCRIRRWGTSRPVRREVLTGRQKHGTTPVALAFRTYAASPAGP